MTIAITGATGQLGRLAIDALLARGAEPADVVAIGRDAAKVDALKPLGVQTRIADYTDVDAMTAALEGVERLLLISSPEVGQRLPQHLNVLEAATRAGVQFLAYTSVVKADTSSLGLAVEHVATEKAIVESGLAHSLLRNGWCAENYTGQLAMQLQAGTILGAAGEGQFSLATRRDLAEAAAVVLLSPEPASVYELGGAAVTLADVAAAVTEVTGTTVTYTDLPPEAYAQVLTDAGVPEGFVGVLVGSDEGAARGDLHVPSGPLESLLGRPAQSIQDAVREAAADLA